MKALTLTEPWATLMAMQVKRIETRSWKLPESLIGEAVAIHSAKGYPSWAKAFRYSKFLRPILGDEEPELNRGKILCIVKFISCRFTQDVRDQISEQERLFGDYDDGRFAWMAEFIERLKEPVPAVGHLGFWEWNK